MPTEEGRGAGASRTKPSGVTSVEARPPAFSLASTISHDGPFYRKLLAFRRRETRDKSRKNRHCAGRKRVRETYDVVEALGSTKAGRASTDNENVDVAADEKAMVSLDVPESIDKHAERRERTYQPLLRIVVFVVVERGLGRGAEMGKEKAGRAVRGQGWGSCREKQRVLSKKLDESKTGNRR
jgi:hypothetical protein